jgi:hypothetical protein
MIELITCLSINTRVSMQKEPKVYQVCVCTASTNLICIKSSAEMRKILIMNFKKVNKFIVIIGCICLIIVGYGVFTERNPIVKNMATDLNIPANMNELENDSELIVKIKVSNNAEEFTEFDEDGTPLQGYTLTGVKVIEVIFGCSSSVGDVITIYEPCYYYKVLGVQKYLITMEDYKPMTMNNEYVLFLRNASNVGDNVYYMVGNQYGKYIAKVLNNSDITAKDIDVYHINEHYIELYTEVMGKYME